jgi:formylglycine-generating enzyme required for sulfatase activity
MWFTATVAGLWAVLVLAGGRPGQGAQPEGREVTIKGNVLSNVHTGEKAKSVFLLAYDGTPEIKAEFDKIMAESYPDKGLDADAARKLQDQFMTRLKYHVDGPLVDQMWKEAQWTVRGVKAVTGVVSEKDGRKWITASKWQAASYSFPAKMLAPDKPLVVPDKDPLVLKINDTLSLKCIYVPAGKFLMGEPYYQCPHWQEDPPHLVTLTRPFYMAEAPISQEVYAAVVGDNPSRLKAPNLPVHNVSCADVYKFCRLLSEKTGRKVSVPTAAQWEYAARVGTSNPTFPERYADQNSNANSQYGGPPLPIKSKRPNAWGFYDMHSGWWERVRDAPVLDREDMVDPQHTPAQDQAESTRSKKHQHVGKGQWTYAISEIEYISSEAGDFRFRIVVEEGPEAAAAPGRGAPTADR